MHRSFRTLSALVAFTFLSLTARGVRAEHADIIDTAVGAGSFKTLAAALTAAKLVKPLKGKGPFTVFAPTDEAFAKLPKGTVEKLLKPENRALLTAILTYHVVPGKVAAKQVVKLKAAKTLNGQRVAIKLKGKGKNTKVHVNGARVVKTDIMASNGIIHVIDSVIMPSSDDIVTTAVKAGSFKTLAAALKAASLVKTLQGKGPFTVFAPTDEAFAKLPEGTVATLLKPENLPKLKAILTYHVVPGRIYSTDLKNGQAAKTAQGAKLTIKCCTTNGVSINDSKVVKADIDASNGVIHVIDSVLLPPTDATASASTKAETKVAQK
ncbi:MAG: fasciclin domain-containing protein [Planctomycetota bacterium]